MEKDKLSVALYLLYRFGPVAVEVLERQKDNVVIASFEGTLVPAVAAFSVSYTELTKQKVSVASLLAVSMTRTATLYRATSAWLGPVGRDLEGFDERGFGINPTVDQDVLADAARLVNVMETDGKDLPYAGTLIEGLRARSEEAAAAHSAAQAARVQYQERQTETRRLGVRLHRELVALRRTLRAEIGTHHLDYQRLRMRPRAGVELLDGQPLAETAPEPQPVVAPSNGRTVPGG